MLKFPKWYDSRENLDLGDVVYFKLCESKMSATWRLGKVEQVMLGSDGFICEVVVSYKDIGSDNRED